MQRRKINDEELLEMHRRGITGRDIARHFQTSPAAVCKRLKKLIPPVGEILDRHKLTEPQKTFVIEKARGRSNAAAVKTAYTVTSNESAKSMGTALMSNTDIRACIEELCEYHGLTRSYLVGRLRTHAANDRDLHLSLKAVDLGLKLTDSYPAQKNTNFNVGIDYAALSERQKELEAQLLALEDSTE